MIPSSLFKRCSSSVISSVLTWVSSSRPISAASLGVISPAETATNKTDDALAVSAAQTIGGSEKVTGRSLRGGRDAINTDPERGYAAPQLCPPRWSFGQPGLPQSFFISREVFGMPIRAQHVFEIGNP